MTDDIYKKDFSEKELLQRELEARKEELKKANQAGDKDKSESLEVEINAIEVAIRDMEEHEEFSKTREKDKKKMIGWGIAAVLALGGFIGVMVHNSGNQGAVGNREEITLEEFQEVQPQHERDVVVVDRAIRNHNEELDAFISEHENEEGVHVFRENEEEVYVFVQAPEGTEPLTYMLYGILENTEDELVVGYNLVEASEAFRHEVPDMLLRVEAEEGVNVRGVLVDNPDYESPEEILQRYEDEGFEPNPEGQQDLDELDDFEEIEDAYPDEYYEEDYQEELDDEFNNEEE